MAMAQDWSASYEDRYGSIPGRNPFGVPPPPPKQVEEDPPPPVEPPIPDHLKIENTVKIVSLSQYRGTPAVGFTDSSSGKSYYLLVGQTADDFVVLDIDMIAGAVELQKGAQENRLYLRNPMTKTNDTAVATSASLSSVPQVTAPPPTNSERMTYADRQRARVEEARLRAEEQRQQRDEAQQKDLEKQVAEKAEAEVQRNMREMYLNMIRNGQEPPVPITLTPEEHKKLVDEGVLDATTLTQ